MLLISERLIALILLNSRIILHSQFENDKQIIINLQLII